jgi:nucleotide-binding universal stress UspA family protein
MTIVCGTDFSEEASNALRVATELAARMSQPLHIVHAVALTKDDLIDSDTRRSLANAQRQRLHDQMEQLQQPGMQVRVHVDEGAPDELLLRVASEVSASLLVVGALGKRKRSQWQLGSHADRLAQRSHVPVLIVRNDGALAAWARDERPLRIMLGADLTASTEVAMHWINELARFGRCDVVAAHLYWPPEEYERLGLSGVRNYIEPVPVVTETLERDIRAHLARATRCTLASVRIEPHLGRVGDRLAALAKEEQCDLIVVGSHDRGATRVWEGSISRVALQQADVSVVCVPAPQQVSLHDLPHLRSVLVATDFSPTGNAAVALAYASAERGATIHLVHVMPDPAHGTITPRDIFPAARTLCDKYRDVCDRLSHLIPAGAATRELKTELHVLESHHTAEAIAQAAERLSVDLICLGTHGRTGIAKAVLGSVAIDVIARSHRPTLLARKPAL